MALVGISTHGYAVEVTGLVGSFKGPRTVGRRKDGRFCKLATHSCATCLDTGTVISPVLAKAGFTMQDALCHRCLAIDAPRMHHVYGRTLIPGLSLFPSFPKYTTDGGYTWRNRLQEV